MANIQRVAFSNIVVAPDPTANDATYQFSYTVSGQFDIDYDLVNQAGSVTGTLTFVNNTSHVTTVDNPNASGNLYRLTSSVQGGQTVYDLQAGTPVFINIGWTGTTATLGNYVFVTQLPDGNLWSTGDFGASPNASIPLSFSAVCFCAGTRIRTARGDIPVEELVVGDLVVTASNAQKPIRWLGHREVDCADAPAKIRPVRIAAHALGHDRPARDLHVSHDHAICFDILGEVLIPAGALVNGATIRQLDAERVTYWHVELDEHDILLAENQPAESYIDTGNRAFFVENDVVSIGARPGVDPATRGPAEFCRPFHAGGPLVEALQTQLRLRAEALGWTLDEKPPLDLHLIVDGARIEPVIRGLACRFEIPASAQEVRLASPIARPADAGQSDERELGVCISALTLCDGFGENRQIDLADPRLDASGFHTLEEGPRRWTSARARLPAEYFQNCPDGTFLRVDLCGPPVARWRAPTQSDAARDASERTP
jgi:hypothetical protein